MSIGGISCLNPALVSEHSSINCTAPEGVGRAKDVIVTVGGQSASGLVFNYESTHFVLHKSNSSSTRRK